MTIIKEGGRDRRENDFYETPLAFAATALYNVPCELLHVKTALDPGMGNGVWGRAFRRYNSIAHLAGVEIAPEGDLCGWTHEMTKEGMYNDVYVSDFTEWETDAKYDLIMGNPPFKFVHEFVDKSLDLLAPRGQLVFLMRLAMLESQKRYKKWWTRTPLKKVMVSPKRISFTNDGKSDDTAYAVFVWQEGWDAKPILEWMWWDYDIIPKPITISGWEIPTPIIPDWHYERIEKEG